MSTTLSLYAYEGCYYCHRVEEAMARLGVLIEYRNILREPRYRAELVAATGRARVPVLRIDDGEHVQWLPESRDIIRYLAERFGDEDAVAEVKRASRLHQAATALPWLLLITGGVLGDPLRVPVWTAAVGFMAVRSGLHAARNPRAPIALFHATMCTLFLALALWINLG